MPKSVAKFGMFFGAFGMIFVVVAAYFAFQDQRLAAIGHRAPGEVVSLKESYDSDGDRTYAPVFVYRDANGTRHEVTSSVKSSPPSFSRGEQVSVLYDPAKPGQAVIDSFGQRFLFPLVFGGFGGVFAVIGGWLVVAHRRRLATIEHLKRRGVRISAEFQSCYRDTSLKINGRSPYRVSVQAKHPATGKLKSYKSDAIWIDLTRQLQGKTVPMLVDPSLPKKHWIDLTEWVDESEQA